MDKLNKIIRGFHHPDLGLLFLRLALGLVFLNSGWFKLNNLDFVAQGFAQSGFDPWMAHLVAYAEFLSGIALIAGLYVRHFSIVIGIIMLVAMLKVHLPNGYSLANNGYEYVLVLLLGALALITSGAGKYSLARRLKWGND